MSGAIRFLTFNRRTKSHHKRKRRNRRWKSDAYRFAHPGPQVSFHLSPTELRLLSQYRKRLEIYLHRRVSREAALNDLIRFGSRVLIDMKLIHDP